MKIFNINLGKSVAREEAYRLFSRWQDDPTFVPMVWCNEVIVELIDICEQFSIELAAIRTDDQSRKTHFNMIELGIAMEGNIEIRPTK
jgi:hypothetical protein